MALYRFSAIKPVEPGWSRVNAVPKPRAKEKQNFFGANLYI
jgi:hypothetical protein